MEFWALIGLACLDHTFLDELQKNRDNPWATVREYGFRLTRWEMGELRRILQLEGAFHQMHMICEAFWAESFNPKDQAPCWWSAERSLDHQAGGTPPYIHPLENGKAVPGKPHAAERE
jgi:hypothetical protein